MQNHGQTFLIIDYIPTITRRFAMSLSQKDQKLVAAGNHTRHLLKMMYDHLVEDYSYCDFTNALSIEELKNYLDSYHNISRVYVFAHFYNALSPSLQQQIQSLHTEVYLVSADERTCIFQSVLLGGQAKQTTLVNPLAELEQIFHAP